MRSDILVAVIGLVGWAVWVGRIGVVAAQMFQIEEYEVPRLVAWGRQRKWLLPRANAIAGGVALGIGLLSLLLPPTWYLAGSGVSLLAGVAIMYRWWHRTPAKKPIVYTPRMRRILGSAAVTLALLVIVLILVANVLPTLFTLVGGAGLMLLMPVIAILCIVIGDWAMTPVERHIQRRFVKQAKARIEEYRPDVVGIAGSYGKTSTKHITAQLLEPQHAVFATPKSFNTLMGITRTINEYLEREHRLFLVEMDAYAVGEIRQMCELVSPRHAIITSLGPQHLERFGTLDRIGDALYELVESIPTGGTVVISCNDRETARLADRAARTGYHVVRYGLANSNNGNEEDFPSTPHDVTASEVVVDQDATHFTWRWDEKGLKYRVSIPLLGAHNILNVTAALAMTHILGLSVEQAVDTAARLAPIPNRLQLIRSPGGVTVIDDSYNANPVGVHNGLEVLAQMQGRTKILVTPGLVELGSVQDEENRRFGEHAARVCDQVILVGARQTLPLQEGARQGGLAPEHLHVVETLDEVTRLIGQLAGAGDVVLFANDLPDTYLELG